MYIRMYLFVRNWLYILTMIDAYSLAGVRRIIDIITSYTAASIDPV